MKKKNLLLTFLLAALILGGGYKAMAYDFSQTEEHGQTLYYTITSAVEPYTVKVTYPYADASINGQAYGNYSISYDKPTGDITIPNSVLYNLIEYKVTAIDKWTFNACTEITSVTIPNNVESIGTCAFNGCTALATLTIGTSVNTLEDLAFQSCTGLTNITLNATLTSVPTTDKKYAFYKCTCANICTLTIGTEVTSIPDKTFSGLGNVGTVNYNATSCADFTSAVNFTLPNDGGYFYIGDNVLRIPAFIFQYKKIAHLTIGSSVTEIGDKSLTSFSLTADIISKPSTPPTIYANTFPTGTKTYPVYVPNGSQNAYQSATYWSSFNNFKRFIEISTHNIVANGGQMISSYAYLFTGAGSITIQSGGKVTCDNILCSTPENLIIEDGGQLVCNNAVEATVKKHIDRYTVASGEPGETNGWYFIASPINESNFSPNDVSQMLDNTYDLYRLNPSTTTWENYQAHNNPSDASPFLTLDNGKGYLYANSENVDLEFAGTVKPYTTDGNAHKITLEEGWNLIGNPYTFAAYIDQPYYSLNGDRSIILATEIKNEPIDPCTGVIVDGGDGLDVVTVGFYTESQSIATPNHGNLELTLAQAVTTRGGENMETIDNAIVSFNEGNQLEKFYFGTQDANIYIPQEGKQYAIVSDETRGEMPVNFKANEDGQYTLTVNAENMEMSYLHLIDNIAGQDIDLIATPSYTFSAKANDYASRFRLVFSGNEINEETINDSFAFISNGEIIVNGTGTLQIIDMMGRVIVSRDAARHVSTKGMTAGVYVLRLIGNETKTQKIVIR